MSNNYLEKAHLSAVIRRDQEQNVISEELVKMFVAIGRGIASKLKLVDPDMAETIAMETLVSVFRKMNPDNNCFGYASQCCRNAFLLHHRQEQKHQKTKMALTLNLLKTLSQSDLSQAQLSKIGRDFVKFSDPDA